MRSLRVARSANVRFGPDPRRVILKPFLPGDEVLFDGSSRIEVVIRRILAMSEEDVAATLQATSSDFTDRHRGFGEVLGENFDLVAQRFGVREDLSADRRLLIGAYFTHEYAVEGAALGNPSIVVAPDQSGLAAGEARFVMSLRAIGEGHISSIEFRSGVIGETRRSRSTTRPLASRPVVASTPNTTSGSSRRSSLSSGCSTMSRGWCCVT